MTTLTPEELITTLEATSQFNDNADICMEDIIATLQAQAGRINDLEAEAEQLRTAAQAVIDRWDTPHWKAVPATAEYIGRLRAALGEKS